MWGSALVCAACTRTVYPMEQSKVLKTRTCLEVYTSAQYKVLKPWTGQKYILPDKCGFLKPWTGWKYILPDMFGFYQNFNLGQVGSIYFQPVQDYLRLYIHVKYLNISYALVHLIIRFVFGDAGNLAPI